MQRYTSCPQATQTVGNLVQVRSAGMSCGVVFWLVVALSAMPAHAYSSTITSSMPSDPLTPSGETNPPASPKTTDIAQVHAVTSSEPLPSDLLPSQDDTGDHLQDSPDSDVLSADMHADQWDNTLDVAKLPNDQPAHRMDDTAPTNSYQRAHADAYASENSDWVDNRRGSVRRWLNRTAGWVDGWFGTSDQNKPASLSLRVMTDVHHDRYNDTTIKPRIRAKIRLPALNDRLSVLIGDDELDDEQGGGIYNDDRISLESSRTLDTGRARRDNTSLALRWSRFTGDIGIQTEVDLGLRSSDLYLRWRGEKRWQLDDTYTRFEQVYRYGTKSEHFALSTLEFEHPFSSQRSLVNRSHIIYTHNDDVEDLGWSNSLYQQHHWQGKLGIHEFSYGLYAGGDLNDTQKSNLNTYGPYFSYRQPLWRRWLFVQADIGYYNNQDENKDHHISSFGRLEVVF